MTLLEDPRGGAARVSRKRDDAPLVGDDDDASPRDGASDFESRVRRAPADALQEGDDVWNAVLTAFEAHCLQGGDAAKNGDETEVAAFDADAAANSAFPGAAPEETSPSLRLSKRETFFRLCRRRTRTTAASRSGRSGRSMKSHPPSPRRGSASAARRIATASRRRPTRRTRRRRCRHRFSRFRVPSPPPTRSTPNPFFSTPNPSTPNPSTPNPSTPQNVRRRI